MPSCRFVSATVYEGRLEPDETTRRRYLKLSQRYQQIRKPAGIQFIPVHHEGNAQGSAEEVSVIQELVAELLSSQLVIQSQSRRLTTDDLVIVAPFNLQVRLLQKTLGSHIRVGSVDKFQGQEAPVVIVSMCASSLEECPRGAEFLLNRNRLNVALSRAQCLAVVVGSPALATARCSSIAEMKLVNLFCRLVDYCSAGGD